MSEEYAGKTDGEIIDEQVSTARCAALLCSARALDVASVLTPPRRPQAASLASKSSSHQTQSSGADALHPRRTATSEESGVNEGGVEGRFAGARVHVGRTGQTGGGAKPQLLPPEEGGDARSQRLGTSSAAFEGDGDGDGYGGPEEKLRDELARNPGGFDADNASVQQPYRAEKNAPAVRTEPQQLEPDQEATAGQYSFNS